MPHIDTPHFDFPFRIQEHAGRTQVIETEQDSTEEIVDCIEVAIRTPRGSREDLPTYGVTDLTFKQMPIDVQQMLDEITQHEDRAEIVITEQPDEFDDLVTRVVTQVATRED